MSTLIEQFEEYKKTDEYETYLENLLKDYPNLFKSQIELSIFTWYNENQYKQYCEENLIEWKSLLEEGENIKVEPAKGGEMKAVDTYTLDEWNEKFSHLEPIKGQSELIVEQDTTFKLPDLTKE